MHEIEGQEKLPFYKEDEESDPFRDLTALELLKLSIAAKAPWRITEKGKQYLKKASTEPPGTP